MGRDWLALDAALDRMAAKLAEAAKTIDEVVDRLGDRWQATAGLQGSVEGDGSVDFNYSVDATAGTSTEPASASVTFQASAEGPFSLKLTTFAAVSHNDEGQIGTVASTASVEPMQTLDLLPAMDARWDADLFL